MSSLKFPGRFSKLFLIILLLSVIVIVGVVVTFLIRDRGEQTENIVPTSSLAATLMAQSPIPTPTSLASALSPLPTALLIQESPLPTPAVSENAGGLSGQIIVTRPSGDVPVAGLRIGLAGVILDEEGLPKASGYEPAVAPKAVTDDNGRFVFSHLAPGMYTIILDAVVTQYQLDDAVTGDTILVEIRPGEVVDLGELRYPSLPIPGFQ